MTELYIQVEALRRAYAAAKADSTIALGAGRGAGAFSLLPDIIDISVKAAAPLVVAAELTRLAGLVEAEGVGTDGGFPDGISTAVHLLLARASELRGEQQ